MFQGSIPVDLRSIVRETCGRWDVSDVYVGCSGNFTIQRVLQDRPYRLHGNDVQVYSCAIGGYLAGQPIELGIREEHREEWGWLEPYLGDADAAVATVMLASNMLAGLGRSNAYYQRIRAAWREQWPDLHARTVERVQAVSLRLASFRAEDVRDFLERCPEDQAFVCFPPFWKGGYEAMYRRLERLFEWAAPSYQPFDPEADLPTLIEAMQARKHWLLGTGEPMEGMELRAEVPTGQGMTCYVYASDGPTRRVAPRRDIVPVTTPRLAPGEDLSGPLTLRTLTPAQFDALRAQYLAPGILTASADVPVAVMVGDRLVGAFAFKLTGELVMGGAPSDGYLLADFAVAPTDEPRLSKLIVIAALSTEAKALAERYANRRIRRLGTTAFTRRKVSMKYRGLLRLRKRRHAQDALGNDIDAISYQGDAGRWSLQEGYELWLAKHRA